ncbi:MAG: hypothetical protein ACRC2V_16270 [Xenococcaceae cyanobacterium]
MNLNPSEIEAKKQVLEEITGVLKTLSQTLEDSDYLIVVRNQGSSIKYDSCSYITLIKNRGTIFPIEDY